MLDPNLSICAGIRWLFRKKQIAEVKLKRPPDWRETVLEYKGLEPRHVKLRARFDNLFAEIKKGRKR